MINAGLVGWPNHGQAFYKRWTLTTACRNKFIQVAVNANGLYKWIYTGGWR